MKDRLVSIDKAGRIVLPKNVREELAIKTGDTFKVSIHGTAVTLTPNAEISGFVRKDNALVFSSIGGATLTHETVTDILDAGRQEREGLSRGRSSKSKRA